MLLVFVILFIDVLSQEHCHKNCGVFGPIVTSSFSMKWLLSEFVWERILVRGCVLIRLDLSDVSFNRQLIRGINTGLQLDLVQGPSLVHYDSLRAFPSRRNFWAGIHEGS